MHVRLPADLAARVAAKAAADRRSLAQTNALLVEQGLRALGEAGGEELPPHAGREASPGGSVDGSRRLATSPVSPSAPAAGGDEKPAAVSGRGGSPEAVTSGGRGRRSALAERGGEPETPEPSPVDGSAVAEPRPRSASAGRTAAGSRRSDMCAHRVRKGSFCKRCGEVVP